MAAYENQNTIIDSFRSQTDLSASAFRCVKYDGGDDLQIADDGASAPLGLLRRDPKNGADGNAAYVAEDLVLGGPARAVASAALATVGTRVRPTTGGKIAAAAAGEWSIGYTMQTAAADGDHVRIWVDIVQLDSDT